MKLGCATGLGKPPPFIDNVPAGSTCAIATGIPARPVSITGQPAYPQVPQSFDGQPLYPVGGGPYSGQPAYPTQPATPATDVLYPTQPSTPAQPDVLQPLGGPISYTPPAGQAFEDPYAVQAAGQAAMMSTGMSTGAWLGLAAVAGGLFWLATRGPEPRKKAR